MDVFDFSFRNFLPIPEWDSIISTNETSYDFLVSFFNFCSSKLFKEEINLLTHWKEVRLFIFSHKFYLDSESLLEFSLRMFWSEWTLFKLFWLGINFSSLSFFYSIEFCDFSICFCFFCFTESKRGCLRSSKQVGHSLGLYFNV